MADFNVRMVAGDPPEALAGLAAGPGGSFFHTPAWLRAVVQAEPRLRPRTLLIEDAGGTVHAACPLLVASHFGILRVYSGAWGTYGGIVGRTEPAVRAARTALERFVASPRVALARVHDFAASLDGEGFWSATEEVCQVLDLPRDPEELFRDAFTMQNRNKIRKAEKQGVRVQCANDRAALGQYAVLYGESAARWEIARPLPSGFFAGLAQVPGVDVWLAEHEGATVAALLNFTWGDQVMNWGNVSRRTAWRLSPNNLLHWRALEAACRADAGPRLYNFGASTGLPGVETFKSAFGVRRQVYARREHRARWVAWIGRGRGVEMSSAGTDASTEDGG